MFTTIGLLLMSALFMHIFAPSLSIQVFTEESVTAVRGTNISIPCNFSKSTDPDEAYHVYWYRHNYTDAPDNIASLVVQEFLGKDIRRGGNRYNITDDHKLVIINVSVTDETTYSCQVVLRFGDNDRGYTNLRVIALAEPLEPIIVSCKVTKPGQCTYTIANEPPEQVTLVCELYDIRPPVNLTWIRSDGRLQKTTAQQFYVNNGLHTISSQLQVSRYDFDYQYKCLAKGEAVSGISSMTAAFGVKKGLHGGFIFLIIIAILAVPAAAVTIYYWRKGFPCSKSDKPVDPPVEPPLNEVQSEINRLRTIIKNYTPGKLTDKVLNPGLTCPDHIRLAVVGATSAGKSSLIRSLKYAYSGKFTEEIEINKGTASGAVTLRSAFYKITESDSIQIQDNKGMLDFDTTNIERIMREIGKEQIHLLVPIFRPQVVRQAGAIGSFLEDLSIAIRDKFASHPVVILTHRDKVTDEEERKRIQYKVANMGIVNDNIKFVENFTEEPENESVCQDLIKEFLEVLHFILIIADSNLVQQLNEGVKVRENSGSPSQWNNHS